MPVNKEKRNEKIPSWSMFAYGSDIFLDAAIDRQGGLMHFSPHAQRIIDHLKNRNRYIPVGKICSVSTGISYVFSSTSRNCSGMRIIWDISMARI
jgi:hypothetical protein